MSNVLKNKMMWDLADLYIMHCVSALKKNLRKMICRTVYRR